MPHGSVPVNAEAQAFINDNARYAEDYMREFTPYRDELGYVVTRKSGRAFVEAGMLLAHFIYWSLPIIEKDDHGKVVGLKPRFNPGQRRYRAEIRALSRKFNLPDETIKSAVKRLLELGLITIENCEERYLTATGQTRRHCHMYITPNFERIMSQIHETIERAESQRKGSEIQCERSAFQRACGEIQRSRTENADGNDSPPRQATGKSPVTSSEGGEDNASLAALASAYSSTNGTETTMVLSPNPGGAASPLTPADFIAQTLEAYTNTRPPSNLAPYVCDYERWLREPRRAGCTTVERLKERFFPAPEEMATINTLLSRVDVEKLSVKPKIDAQGYAFLDSMRKRLSHHFFICLDTYMAMCSFDAADALLAIHHWNSFVILEEQRREICNENARPGETQWATGSDPCAFQPYETTFYTTGADKDFKDQLDKVWTSKSWRYRLGTALQNLPHLDHFNGLDPDTPHAIEFRTLISKPKLIERLARFEWDHQYWHKKKQERLHKSSR